MLHRLVVSRRGLRGTARPGRPGAAVWRRRLASRDVAVRAVMRRGRDDSMTGRSETNQQYPTHGVVEDVVEDVILISP